MFSTTTTTTTTTKAEGCTIILASLEARLLARLGYRYK
jgi:hypothetical protein